MFFQDEPAEDACQNTDAWKECGEAPFLVTVTGCERFFWLQHDQYDTMEHIIYII